MHCPNCNQEIHPLSAWLTGSGKFYCSEFCAEADGVSIRQLAPPKYWGQPSRGSQAEHRAA